MTVANQKHIGAIHKEPCDTKNVYLKLNIEALQNASLNLKPSTLKVWLYFAKNQDGYEFDLSSVAVCNFCNICDKTYKTAIKELMEKKYLVQREKNVYDFYEFPIEFKEPKNGDRIICHTSTEILD